MNTSGHRASLAWTAASLLALATSRNGFSLGTWSALNPHLGRFASVMPKTACGGAQTVHRFTTKSVNAQAGLFTCYDCEQRKGTFIHCPETSCQVPVYGFFSDIYQVPGLNNYPCWLGLDCCIASGLGNAQTIPAMFALCHPHTALLLLMSFARLSMSSGREVPFSYNMRARHPVAGFLPAPSPGHELGRLEVFNTTSQVRKLRLQWPHYTSTNMEVHRDPSKGRFPSLPKRGL